MKFCLTASSKNLRRSIELCLSSLPELRQKFDYLSQYAMSLVSTPEDRLNECVKKLRPDLRPYAALITTTDFNAAYDLIVKTKKSLDDLQATKKEDRATKDSRPAASTGPSGKSFGFGGKRYEKGSSSAPPPKRRHFRRHCPTNPSSEPVLPRAPDQPAASHPARSQQSTAANNQQRPRPQQSGQAPARTYAMHGRTDPSPDVILGTFILFDSVMHALIDPGSTLSYICVGMPANSAIVRSDLEIPTVVSNPLGHSMRLHHIYHRCPLSAQGKQFPADLIELPHKEFDIILGMDWLTEHREVVDCSCRTVRLRAEDGSDVSLSREVFPKAPEFISSLSARRLIRKKCEMFLCHVQDMRKESPRQQDIRTVCDFPDVFPEDLPDPTHVLPTNAVTLDESLSYEEEPVKFLARETKVLRNKTVPLVKPVVRRPIGAAVAFPSLAAIIAAANRLPKPRRHHRRLVQRRREPAAGRRRPTGGASRRRRRSSPPSIAAPPLFPSPVAAAQRRPLHSGHPPPSSAAPPSISAPPVAAHRRRTAAPPLSPVSVTVAASGRCPELISPAD
ncbi:unnamed protein product [Cuscuta campestris]|uniref:Retrotransposon gag domain-containing protein n=1 Tax=Cuscuta campestris TaxID=132261 RepID=A0A484LAE9_9ASTE|nr:unnamed protein product [Cuscuta campestris]